MLFWIGSSRKEIFDMGDTRGFIRGYKAGYSEGWDERAAVLGESEPADTQQVNTAVALERV